MLNKTPASSPPMYCSQDGMVLLDKTTEIRMGFDPFTGRERPVRHHITRECQIRGHDVWVLTDSGEYWVRP